MFWKSIIAENVKNDLAMVGSALFQNIPTRINPVIVQRG
jgi:hypothetical protein